MAQPACLARVLPGAIGAGQQRESAVAMLAKATKGEDIPAALSPLAIDLCCVF